jgi:hypothetical protein
MDQEKFTAMTPEHLFWDWFKANSARLMNFEYYGNPILHYGDPILEELTVELNKVSNGLTFQFSSKDIYGREFVVSADGIRQLFSTVIKLVGAAPALPGWKIVAFRQPMSPQFSLDFGGFRLLTDDIWFKIISKEYWVDITLYVKGLSRKNRHVVQHASLIALDNVLGEYDVEMKVGRIYCQSLPKDPIKSGLKLFRDLPEVIRAWEPSTSLPLPPLRVFLCHSSNDKPAIRKLYQKLLVDGFKPWLDEEDLLPGQDWQSEIVRSLNSADVVLVCLSSGSISKTGYVQKEIKDILDIADKQPENVIFLIPVRLEKCTIPERLNRWQWVDLFEKRGYERLIRALHARANTLKHIGKPK